MTMSELNTKSVVEIERDGAPSYKDRYTRAMSLPWRIKYRAPVPTNPFREQEYWYRVFAYPDEPPFINVGKARLTLPAALAAQVRR